MSEASVFREYHYPNDSSASQRDEFRGLVAAAVEFQAQVAKGCDAVLRIESTAEHLTTGIRVRHEPASAAFVADPYLAAHAVPAESIAALLLVFKRALSEFAKNTRSAVHGSIVPGAILRRAGSGEFLLADYGIAQAYARAFRPDILTDLAVRVPDADPGQPTAVWEEIGRHIHDRFDRYVPYVAHEKLATHAWNAFEPPHDLYASGVLAFLLCESSHPYLDKGEAEHLLAESAEMIPFHPVPLTLMRKLDVSTPLGKALRGIIEKLVDSNPSSRADAQSQIELLPRILNPDVRDPAEAHAPEPEKVAPELAVPPAELERERQREIAVSRIRAAVRALPQRQLAQLIPADMLEAELMFTASQSGGFSPEIADVEVRFLNAWKRVPPIRESVLVVEIVADDELPQVVFNAIVSSIKHFQQTQFDTFVQELPSQLGEVRIALQESLPQRTAHVRIEAPALKFATTQVARWNAKTAEWSWQDEAGLCATALASIREYASTTVKQECAGALKSAESSLVPENLKVSLQQSKKPPATLAAMKKSISFQGTLHRIDPGDTGTKWAPIFRCVIHPDRRVECTPAIDRLLHRAETDLAAPSPGQSQPSLKISRKAVMMISGVIGAAAVVGILFLLFKPEKREIIEPPPIVEAPQNDQEVSLDEETFIAWNPKRDFAGSPFEIDRPSAAGGWVIAGLSAPLDRDRSVAIEQLKKLLDDSTVSPVRLQSQYLLGRLLGETGGAELDAAIAMLDWLYERRAGERNGWDDVEGEIWPREIQVDNRSYRAFFLNGSDGFPTYVQNRADTAPLDAATLTATLAQNAENAAFPMEVSVLTVQQWLKIASFLESGAMGPPISEEDREEFLWGTKEWCRKDENASPVYVSFGGMTLKIDETNRRNVPDRNVPLAEWPSNSLVYQPLRQDETYLRRVLEMGN